MVSVVGAMEERREVVEEDLRCVHVSRVADLMVHFFELVQVAALRRQLEGCRVRVAVRASPLP